MRGIILLGGCFWGLEHAMRHIPGVVEARAGYAGGANREDLLPTYYNLDLTGDAEAVRVRYDPDQTDLQGLLECFAEKSGNDPSPASSPRYRRAVSCQDPGQVAMARRLVQRLLEEGRPIFEVVQGLRFVEAEDYHQKYYQRTMGI